MSFICRGTPPPVASKTPNILAGGNAPEQQSAVVVSSRGAAHQNTVRNIGLIIKHEYKKRLTQRSFIISTIIILLFVVIGAFVPTIIRFFTSTANGQTKIVVVNKDGPIAGLDGDALARSGVELVVQRFAVPIYPRQREIAEDQAYGISALDAWFTLGAQAPRLLLREGTRS